MIGMKEFPDKHFDLAICDPPYMVGFSKMGYFGSKNSSKGVPRGKFAIPEWDNQIPGESWLNELVRVSKHQIIWGINYFKFYHTPGRIVWDKCNDKAPISNCEIASCSLHESTRIVRYMWNGMNQGDTSEPTKMQGNKSLNEKRIHPTQKPLYLYRWILQKYAKEGDNILDTHLGSQSSRIAAFDMGFDFTGYELDKDYFEAGCKRFNQHKAQLKLFV
jgi:site-specific DNA-methyltransferase (adenine-specific)